MQLIEHKNNNLIHFYVRSNGMCLNLVIKLWTTKKLLISSTLVQNHTIVIQSNCSERCKLICIYHHIVISSIHSIYNQL